MKNYLHDNGLNDQNMLYSESNKNVFNVYEGFIDGR
jgi:hypothetical protein